MSDEGCAGAGHIWESCDCWENYCNRIVCIWCGAIEEVEPC